MYSFSTNARKKVAFYHARFSWLKVLYHERGTVIEFAWPNVIPRTSEIMVHEAPINHGKSAVVDEPNGHVANSVNSAVTPSSLSATVANRGRY